MQNEHNHYKILSKTQKTDFVIMRISLLTFGIHYCDGKSEGYDI